MKTPEAAKEDSQGIADIKAQIFENFSLSAEQFGKRGSRRTAAYIELERCRSHHAAGKYDVCME
jgi:hypothetical protein